MKYRTRESVFGRDSLTGKIHQKRNPDVTVLIIAKKNEKKERLNEQLITLGTF